MRIQDIMEQSGFTLRDFIIRVSSGCKPFLKDKDPGQVFFRGVKSESSRFIFYKDIRKDRRSVDTPQTVSSIVDEVFKKDFGYAFRSQSIFVSPKYHSVRFYGTPYSVYPLGNFKYLWSPNVSDLFSVLSSLMQKKYDIASSDIREYDDLPDDVKKFMSDVKERVDNFLSDLPGIIRSFDYRMTGMDEAFNKNHEVMILADGYHGIRIEPDAVEEATRVDHEIYDYMEKKK